MDIALNNIKAIVKRINNYDGVNIVEFDFNGTTLSMMSLELSDKTKEGCSVILGAKPSHITLAKDFNIKISYSNKIKTIITKIIKGKLLSSVIVSINNSQIESLLTTQAIEEMELKVGEEVVTLINSSELFIKEIIC